MLLLKDFNTFLSLPELLKINFYGDILPLAALRNQDGRSKLINKLDRCRPKNDEFVKKKE